MTREKPDFSYAKLTRLLNEVWFACDKACGCGECNLRELDNYAFADDGVFYLGDR